MNYQQTIEYLYAQLPMFSKVGHAAYKEDLHNTNELCAFLDNPQSKFKTVHIAGTNGKGSTSHILAAMLQQAGYKTGLYTSPHLKDFRERIKINGEMVSENFVTDFVKRTQMISDQISPSFFELTVAMAFEWFAEQQVDIAIIETGLGGRLDSTNIINPILSVITNIGYDHINILGNTLQQIAAEKAGIIKSNVPVVIGEYLHETKQIFIQKATECNAPIYFAQEKFEVSNVHYNMYDLKMDVEDTENKCKESFVLDLNGLYQIKNICTVLCAEGLLSNLGFLISNEAEKYALANVKKLTGFRGRWDVIEKNPAVILDVAHNEDGIRQVLNQIQNSKLNNPEIKYHFVIGMVKDKDINKVLSLLPVNASYYFTNAHIPRALSAADLQSAAVNYGLIGLVFDNVNEAISHAKSVANPADIIIVCGSVFLVAEVN